MTKSLYDVIIIGAGPAGLTAALYTARYKMKTLLLEKMAVGGQILMSPWIDNFPGFPGGISTEELIERCHKQVRELDVPVQLEEVIEIRSRDDLFEVVTPESVSLTSSIILASGAQPKRLGLKDEERFTGRGVSYCATCDGPLYKNKDVVVIGGGDRALEEALYLANVANLVYLVHRRSGFRASGIVLEKAKANPKIRFVLDSTIEDIKGENKVESVAVKNVLSNALIDIPCQGLFIFVGIEPYTSFAGKLLATDEKGFIITTANMATSRPGIFAAGDCCRKELYQVVSACAEGAVAAYSAHNYLLSREHV